MNKSHLAQKHQFSPPLPPLPLFPPPPPSPLHPPPSCRGRRCRYRPHCYRVGLICSSVKQCPNQHISSHRKPQFSDAPLLSCSATSPSSLAADAAAAETRSHRLVHSSPPPPPPLFRRNRLCRHDDLSVVPEVSSSTAPVRAKICFLRNGLVGTSREKRSKHSKTAH